MVEPAVSGTGCSGVRGNSNKNCWLCLPRTILKFFGGPKLVEILNNASKTKSFDRINQTHNILILKKDT